MEIKDAIRKVVERQDLSEAEAHAALGTIMDGQATPAQIAAFITALRMKGERVEEIAGFARAMRERALRIRPRVEDLVDVVGTGGDRVYVQKPQLNLWLKSMRLRKAYGHWHGTFRERPDAPAQAVTLHGFGEEMRLKW